MWWRQGCRHSLLVLLDENCTKNQKTNKILLPLSLGWNEQQARLFLQRSKRWTIKCKTTIEGRTFYCKILHNYWSMDNDDPYSTHIYYKQSNDGISQAWKCGILSNIFFSLLLHHPNGNPKIITQKNGTVPSEEVLFLDQSKLFVQMTITA